MNSLTFYAICEEIKNDSKKKNPEVIIIVNGLTSHGGYSSSSMEFENIKLNDITYVEDGKAIKIKLPKKEDADGDGKFVSVSIMDHYFKKRAYAYVPLENVVCIFFAE